MFEKVDSFTEEHQLSRTHCVSVCDNGVSGMTRMKSLCIHEKLKQKCLGTVAFFAEKKNQTTKKFKI